MQAKNNQSNQILYFFKAEWAALLAVTISGLIYNIGLLANPWFEGQLAGYLVDHLLGKSTATSMLTLVIWYVTIISIVQIARYIKRFYVRRFANNVNRRMKKILYHNLLQKSKADLESEGAGNLMTKAISDVDDCVEGMRKFTTEVFDTGVAMVCYICMLLSYDWRLALLSMLFPPISYFLAEKMKRLVQRTGASFKEQAGALSADTLDRVSNAVTYRVFGCEAKRDEAYEESLTAYEKSAIKANIWVSALPPLYNVICMIGAIFILYFGSRNILGNGWKSWNIAAFTTFLSCYAKLSTKSSKAAKLFNSVHKAQVSWKRIKPLLHEANASVCVPTVLPQTLTVKNLGFAYPGAHPIFTDLSFTAFPGQIIGITGPVACGKSTLGKAFLCEYPYEGSICFGKDELCNLPPNMQRGIVNYLGHDPELLSDSIINNIFLGDSVTTALLNTSLDMVCFREEVEQMPAQENTRVGNSGVRLSGGQAQRLALARTLHAPKPLLILDDPFSALDNHTEKQVFQNIRTLTDNQIVLFISHRLYLFPEFDQIIWMDGQSTTVGTHKQLMEQIPQYKELYLSQKGGMCNAQEV